MKGKQRTHGNRRKSESCANERRRDLQLPSGWTAVPASRSFSVAQQKKESLSSWSRSPQSLSDFTVQAIAHVGNQEIKNGYTLIAYPTSSLCLLTGASKVEIYGPRDDNLFCRLRRGRGRHS
jgi:hypothetical protein